MPTKSSGRYRVFDYALTGNPDETDGKPHYSEEIKTLLLKTFNGIKGGRRGMKKELNKLIAQYPHVPAFKNYLSVYYNMKGDLERAYEVNEWLVKEHPDYLHGKINLAAQFLEEKRYEKIPEILGEALDLKDMYPKRKVFHFSEYEGLLRISCRYLIETGNLEAAETRIKMAEEVLKDSETLNELWAVFRAKRAEQQDSRRHTKAAKPSAKIRFLDTVEKPKLIHPEIEDLYHFGLDIDHSILRNIISLPEETLVQDLKTVLMDSVFRNEYFENRVKKGGDWDENEMSFPIHALFLLTELGSEKALAIVLDYLRQDSEILDYWLSVHFTETVWELLYHLGNTRLDVLRSFMKEPNVYFWSKTAVSDAVVQILLHQTERREEGIEWFSDIFEFYLANVEDEKLVDPELISFLIIDATDFRSTELLPLIERLFERDLVLDEIVGDLESVKKIISFKIGYIPIKDVFDNMFDRYQQIVDIWGDGDDEDEGDWDENELFPAKDDERTDDDWTNRAFQETVKRDSPKVGRNDPCPCGSEKKYKRCCWKKDRT